MNKTYIFFGIGSEYILSPLAQYMKDKGYSCLEIDLYKAPLNLSQLKNLKNKQTIFITSAHLFYDQINYTIHQPKPWKIYNPLEIMSYLAPLKSYFMPHDITELLHLYDLPWIDLFDGLLAPTDELNFLSSKIKVIPVGWINCDSQPKTNFLEAFPSSIKTVALPSEISYYLNVGIEEFYRQWGCFIKEKIPFKLPNFGGAEQLENFIEECGAVCLSRDIPAFSLINEADIILTNGTSSINREAALHGKTTLNLLDGTHPYEKLNHYFLDYPMIQLVNQTQAMDYIEAVHQKRVLLNTYPCTIQTFDYEKARMAVTD